MWSSHTPRLNRVNVKRFATIHKSSRSLANKNGRIKSQITLKYNQTSYSLEYAALLCHAKKPPGYHLQHT